MASEPGQGRGTLMISVLSDGRQLKQRRDINLILRTSYPCDRCTAVCYSLELITAHLSEFHGVHIYPNDAEAVGQGDRSIVIR